MKRLSGVSVRRVSRALCTVAASAASALAQTTTLVSLPDAGMSTTNAPTWIGESAISADGRYVVFSTDEQFTFGDVNGQEDVFVRDRWSERTELVSVDSNGAQSNGQSRRPSISSDGRVVAFASIASNLVPGDTNADYDLFVHERTSGLTERVNVSLSGGQSYGMVVGEIALSSDGRYAAFASEAGDLVAGDANGTWDVFVRDRLLQQTLRVSVDPSGLDSDGASGYPRLSEDGRFCVFNSHATNLITGDTNNFGDVFVRDLALGVTERVSLAAGGAQANEVSNDGWVSTDGRFVAFASQATNLVGGDTNGKQDIFVRDRASGATERVSVSSLGVQADNWSSSARLSADGRLVMFKSAATNLAPGNHTNYSVYVHDRLTHATECASVTNTNAALNNHVNLCTFSASGRFVVFQTTASNVCNGCGGTYRVYVRDRTGLAPTRYCTATPNSSGCLPQIDSRGVPSASGTGPFLIGATQVHYWVMGMLFYGLDGPRAEPFPGGVLCIQQRLRRTALQPSKRLGVAPCEGLHVYDFNKLIDSGIDPGLRYGRQVWVQYWSRDPAAPSGGSLTDALTFVIGS